MLGMEARPQGHHGCVQRGHSTRKRPRGKVPYCAAKAAKHAVSCRPHGHVRTRKGYLPVPAAQLQMGQSLICVHRLDQPARRYPRLLLT